MTLICISISSIGGLNYAVPQLRWTTFGLGQSVPDLPPSTMFPGTKFIKVYSDKGNLLRTTFSCRLMRIWCPTVHLWHQDRKIGSKYSLNTKLGYTIGQVCNIACLNIQEFDFEEDFGFG